MSASRDAHRLGLQLLAPSDPAERAVAASAILLDLLIEVQALREALADVPEAQARYRKAYERVCLLSHNSAGVTPGEVKVLSTLLSEREAAWLKRLGATAAELAAFEAECRRAETFT